MEHKILRDAYTVIPPPDPSLYVVPPGFTTPCHAYPPCKWSRNPPEYGDARLICSTAEPGIRWAGGVHRATFIRWDEPIDVPTLQTREGGDDWRTWMVADPIHWDGISELVARIKGPRVCVGGLGLGMVVWQLLERQDITRIEVIERHPDVIALIRPLLPNNPRLCIHQGDFWTHAAQLSVGVFQTFFIDLWRGPVVYELPNVMERAQEIQRRHPWPLTEALYLFFQEAVDRWREGLYHVKEATRA